MNGEISNNSESSFSDDSSRSSDGSQAVVRTFEGIDYVGAIADIAKVAPKLFLFKRQSGRNYELMVKPITVRDLNDIETLVEGVNEIEEARDVSAGNAIDLIVRAAKTNPKLGLAALIDQVLKEGERGGGGRDGGGYDDGRGGGRGGDCRGRDCDRGSSCRSGHCGSCRSGCKPSVRVPVVVPREPRRSCGRCTVVVRPGPVVVTRPPVVVRTPPPKVVIERGSGDVIAVGGGIDRISASASQHTIAQCIRATKYIVLNGSVVFDLTKASNSGPTTRACYNEALQCHGGGTHKTGPLMCCRPPLRPNSKVETTMPWRCKVTQPGPNQVWVQ
jgi:hypothetical protein